MGKLARALLPALLWFPATAQKFDQRGFLESDLSLYPETAPNDSSHAIDDSLFSYEASYKVLPWLRLAGSFDARFDTHEQAERAAHLDWQDRSLRRPGLSLGEFNAAVKGKTNAARDVADRLEGGLGHPYTFFRNILDSRTPMR